MSRYAYNPNSIKTYTQGSSKRVRKSSNNIEPRTNQLKYSGLNWEEILRTPALARYVMECRAGISQQQKRQELHRARLQQVKAVE